MTLKKQMQTVEYLEARLWDAIKEIDLNRDEFTDQELRRAFQSLEALSTHIKRKIIKGK
jgi:hypothetical protein